MACDAEEAERTASSIDLSCNFLLFGNIPLLN